MTLAELLAEWMPTQRWFAGKGRGVARVDVEQTTTLAEPGTFRLLHLLVLVRYADDAGGPGDLYQVPVAVYQGPVEGRHKALVGEATDGGAGGVTGFVYDGLLDPDGDAVLLGRLRSGEAAGPISFVRTTELEDVRGLPVSAEQSNTSIVFGSQYILKVFRLLGPGINPDLEITRALAEVDSAHVARPLGWIETPVSGVPTTLAFLQVFLRAGTEGWRLARASVRDLYAEADLHPDEVGGDFASESERLGRATASVHAALAETLGTRLATPDEIRAIAARMHERLDIAMRTVPALERFEAAMRTVYNRLGKRAAPVELQRVHGDFHLGQVLRTETGWVLFDFEGEPARPLAERRAMSSPLQDVAGMLRSFEYAAHSMLLERQGPPSLAYRAEEWAERNKDAFCDGYTSVVGEDPRDDAVLLTSFEFDKAVYEAVYEARHRPKWLPIPLGSLARLAETVVPDTRPDD